jgi:predicted nucleotidyltransferase
MKTTSLDLSLRNDLHWLSSLVSAVRFAAAGIPFFLAGAVARDLLLWYGYGITTGRATQDVDIAFFVAGWDDFSSLKSRLTASGVFLEVPGIVQRVRFKGTLDVDLLPFGGVEDSNRSITWPPQGDFVLNVFAFKEVLADVVEVKLPAGELVHVPSLAGVGLLKLVAWADRRLRAPGKDAGDFALILRHYLPAGNEERLYAEGAHLLAEEQFDYEVAGAWLLGHDMARLLGRDGQMWLLALLNKEGDSEGSLRLVGDMRVEPRISLPLVQAMARAVGEVVEGPES